MDKEFNLEDEQEAQLMEQKAIELQVSVNINTYPTRLYLEQTTIPTIYEALKALAKERPVNPIEFFSYYLLTHNPYRQSQHKQENEIQNKGSQQQEQQ